MGDESGLFESISSEISTIWIPVRNSKPIFLPSRPLTFDKDEDFNNKVLFSLNNQFKENDPIDDLTLKVLIPNELENFIEYNQETNSIELKEDKVISELPLGNFRIRVEARDSSYLFGEKQAKAKGILRLNIVDNEETEEFVRGLDLINRLEK